MKGTDSPKRMISIVIPVLNEEENVELCYDSLSKVLAKLPFEFEILFTDNHSSDRTFVLIQKLAETDSRVKAARFSANVGYQRSILSGLLLARGDAIIQLDCDLQDPPSLIPKMISLWQDNHQVVYGIRERRKEGLIITACRKLFYLIVDVLSPKKIPRDAGDFRLIDRCVVEAIARNPIKSPYIRGEIAKAGFNQVGFKYDREKRQFGETKFTMSRLFRLTADAIVSQSVIPLRMATFIGFFATLASIILIVVYSIASIWSGAWPPGFTTLAVLGLFNIGLVSLLLGILGEYLIRVIEQVSQGPVSVVQETINIEAGRIARRTQVQYAPPSTNQTDVYE